MAASGQEASPLSVAVRSRLEQRATPLLWRHVAQRLRERPLVAGEILRGVLALAVGEVGRLHHDARALLAGMLAMRTRVVHSHQHAVRDLAGARLPALVARFAHDHRGVGDAELRAVALTDAQPLAEPERGAE